MGERAFAHGGAGLAALCDWLVSIAGEAGRVAVAIEVPHGPVVDALLDRGFAVHAINPKQLERLRDRVSLAGAKDDRRDVRVAAGGLRTDPHLFRPVEAGDPAVIALREWSHLAEELQQERVLGPSPGLNSHFVIGLVIAASANYGPHASCPHLWSGVRWHTPCRCFSIALKASSKDANGPSGTSWMA